jgi:hypothetical protein
MIKIFVLFGGSDAPSSTTSLDPEFKARILGVADRAIGGYDLGAFNRVADASDLQQVAFGSGARDMSARADQSLDSLTGQQGRLTNLANTGGIDEGLIQSALLKTRMDSADIGKAYGGAGTLGSARQNVQEGAMKAAVAADLNNRAFQNRMAAENQLGNVNQTMPAISGARTAALAQLGDQKRGIHQQNLDAQYQGLSRLAGMLNPNALAKEGSTTQSGGGGK